MKFSVVMFGARRHYAVPRILHESDLLQRFYTDITAVQGWPKFISKIPSKYIPAALQRLQGRIPKDIPVDKITSYPSFGLLNQIRLSSARNLSDQLKCHVSASISLNNKILDKGFSNKSILYTFDRAGLELMQYVKSKGGRAVMEQTVIPFRSFQKIVVKEQSLFPAWSKIEDKGNYDWFAEREEEEWHLADMIICGSEFVKRSIADCGGPVDKCHVVPYGIDNRFFESNYSINNHAGPLRVLVVGEVSVRKGSHYVYAAAQRLKGLAEFRMVGSFNVNQEVLASLGDAIELTGPVPRAVVKEHFKWADVFLLPSLVEGSAMVTYEALAAGIPVICTPNTGSVVKDGFNGFLVPACDVDAICAKINYFLDNREILRHMAINARNSGSDYSFGTYKDSLITCLNDFQKIYF